MKKDGIQTRNRKVSQKSKKCRSNGGFSELEELSLDYLIKPTLTHLTAASHLAAAAGYHPHKMAGYMSSYLDGVSSAYTLSSNSTGYPPVDNAAAVASAAMVAMGGSQTSPYAMSQPTSFPLTHPNHSQTHQMQNQTSYRSSAEPTTTIGNYFGDSGFHQNSGMNSTYSIFEGQQFPKTQFPRPFFQGQPNGTTSGEDRGTETTQYQQRFLSERNSYDDNARLYSNTATTPVYSQESQLTVPPTTPAANLANYISASRASKQETDVAPSSENTPAPPMY